MKIFVTHIGPPYLSRWTRMSRPRGWEEVHTYRNRMLGDVSDQNYFFSLPYDPTHPRTRSPRATASSPPPAPPPPRSPPARMPSPPLLPLAAPPPRRARPRIKLPPASSFLHTCGNPLLPAHLRHPRWSSATCAAIFEVLHRPRLSESWNH